MPKAQKKKQDKIIQDRTFGLKNKNKSKTVQNYVKGVEHTVKHAGKSTNLMQNEQFERKKNKKKQEEENALLDALYGEAHRVKGHNEIEDDQDDPKNTVCPYFKQGLCNRGKKCIYSHDLALDRTEEIDLYVDQRTQLIMNEIGGKSLNTMTEVELNKIIAEKEATHKGSQSSIVCKHFLDAVERSKYGWNWTCPNGDEKCQYKHCLPPGYKLKKDIPKVAQEAIDIEAKIDEERNNFLNQNTGSPLVTFDIFMKWKTEKMLRRKIEVEQKKKEDQKKKNKNMRTGRQLFTFDPTLFIDDEEAAADYDDRMQEEQEQEQQESGDEEKREQQYPEEDEEEGQRMEVVKEEEAEQTTEIQNGQTQKTD